MSEKESASSRRVGVRGILALALLICGCSSSGAQGVLDDSSAEALRLVVDSDVEVVVGLRETHEFSVRVVDELEAPRPGVRVAAGFVGNAHNATITPLEGVSDDAGEVRFSFVAPDLATAFEVRFAGPEVAGPVYVPVTVDAERLGIAVTFSYDGDHEIASVMAELWETVSCEDLLSGAVEGAPFATSESLALPASFRFSGLLADRLYAVVGYGRDAAWVTRARFCRDGLVPTAAGEALAAALDEQALDLAGQYQLAISVDGAALAPVLDELIAVFDPLTVDLDQALATGLVDNLVSTGQLVGGTVDDQAIRSALAADFTARGVDLGAWSSELEVTMKAGVAGLELTSVLEFGEGLDTASRPFTHQVTGMRFAGLATDFLPAFSETGAGEATFAEAGGQLTLGAHSIGLSLGSVLEWLLGKTLLARFGSAMVSTVLEEEIDCDAVALALEPQLGSQVETTSVVAACESVIGGYESEAHLVNLQIGIKRPQLAFLAGSCTPAAGETNAAAAGFDAGSFSLYWTGSATVGPLPATFSGARVEE